MPAAPAAARERLATIIGCWEQVFERPVGPDDDFFADLDGNSLAALQIVNLIEDELGVEVTVADLFDGPTAAHLAAVVEELLADG